MFKSFYILYFIALSLFGFTGCSAPEQTSESNALEIQQQPKILSSAAPEIVMRSNSGERRTLARLVQLLQELNHLIIEAETRANPDARIKFDYAQLRYDLQLITQGISAHVHRPDFTPRTVEPIAGNYNN